MPIFKTLSFILFVRIVITTTLVYKPLLSCSDSYSLRIICRSYNIVVHDWSLNLQLDFPSYTYCLPVYNIIGKLHTIYGPFRIKRFLDHFKKIFFWVTGRVLLDQLNLLFTFLILYIYKLNPTNSFYYCLHQYYYDPSRKTSRSLIRLCTTTSLVRPSSNGLPPYLFFLLIYSQC